MPAGCRKRPESFVFENSKKSPGMTHSLIYLATECKLPQIFFPFLRKLTPQFVTTRYPDAAYGTPSELYDESVAEEFLQDTKKVMQWLKLKIVL